MFEYECVTKFSILTALGFSVLIKPGDEPGNVDIDIYHILHLPEAMKGVIRGMIDNNDVRPPTDRLKITFYLMSEEIIKVEPIDGNN